mgnify:CR=1 FL=1
MDYRFSFLVISIHAPRVGRDEGIRFTFQACADFNPRAPRGARQICFAQRLHDGNFNPRAPRGARHTLFVASSSRHGFQSTRPAWGATGKSFLYHQPSSNFNPRAPRGARPWPPHRQTSPRAFQSTRPAWGATKSSRMNSDVVMISIHAPRVGRDQKQGSPHTKSLDFNPRAPRGARLLAFFGGPARRIFQSTRPAWGATLPNLGSRCPRHISIHAPRVGRDPAGRSSRRRKSRFQSTRPAWGATRVCA